MAPRIEELQSCVRISIRVHFIHLLANTLGKYINPSSAPQLLGNSRTDGSYIALGGNWLNSKSDGLLYGPRAIHTIFPGLRLSIKIVERRCVLPRYQKAH